MLIVRRAASALVVLAFGALITALLSFIRRADIGPQHLVFFYLLPISFGCQSLRQLGRDAEYPGRHFMRRVFSL